jgi:uncharacterized protein
MFKRQKPLTKLQRLRESCWPSMGWQRASRYIWLRIIRLSDATHSIAMGLAIGVAVSFSPLLGTHFLQCAVFAWLLRVNILCAIIGNIVGNPWTYPFLWWAGLEFGSLIFKTMGSRLPSTEFLLHDFNFSKLWHLLQHQPLDVLLPWLVGGTLLGLISIPIVYIISYRLVEMGRRAYKNSRRRNRQKLEAAQEIL